MTIAHLRTGRARKSLISVRYSLATLGGAALRVTEPDGSTRTVFGTGKPLAIIAYLDAAPGGRASRDHLIDLLWADLDPGDARHALRQLIFYVRQRLGENALASREDVVSLTLPIDSDRRDFLQAIEAGDAEQAVDLYHGEFLPGYAAPGGAAFEHWADLERDRLTLMFLRAGQSAVRGHLATGRGQAAHHVAERVRRTVPGVEAAQRLPLEVSIAQEDALSIAVDVDHIERWLAECDHEPEPVTRELLLRASRSDYGVEAATASVPLSTALSVKELIGREREFQIVLRSAAQLRGGIGHHVHFRGRPGLGKTRLLADLERRFRTSGQPTVTARANPGEQTVPYALVADLALRLADMSGAAAVSPASAASLVALQPSLSAHYPYPADPSTGPEAVRRRLAAMTELVSTIADEQPFVALLDDLHWADPASLQLLTGVAQRLAAIPCLLVTTARPNPAGVAVGPSAETMELAPLTEEQTAELVAGLGALPRDQEWTPWFASGLHRATGGSPLLLLETLRLAVQRGILSLSEAEWKCHHPADLRKVLEQGGALRHRITQLSPDQQHLLRLVAAVGRPVDDELLARLTGVASTTAGALRQLEMLGLLARRESGWAPGHDEIAALALETASVEERRSLHTAVGRAQAAKGAEDVPTLLRATQQLAAGGAQGEVPAVLTRLVRVVQRTEGRTDVKAIVAEVLGERADSPRVQATLREIPRSLRLGLAVRARRRRVSLAACALAVSMFVGTGLLLRPEEIPDAELYVMVRPTADSSQVYRIPIYRDRQRPLRISDGRRLPQLSMEGFAEGWAPSPDGTRWVLSRLNQDSQDVDLILVDRDGSQRYLTNTRGDDVHPSWSPDGTRIAFATSRWSTNGIRALAILDLKTLKVTPLITGDSIHVRDPTWSPSGTHLAFSSERYGNGTFHTCVTTIDGIDVRCFVDRLTISRPVTWKDAGHLIVEVWRDSLTEIEVLDITTGETSTLPLTSAPLRTGVVFRGNGGWFASSEIDPVTQNVHLTVHDVVRPEVSWPLVQPSHHGQVAFAVLRVPQLTDSMIQSIAISRFPDTLPYTSPVLLSVNANNSAGGSVDIPTVRWTVVDTTLAHVTQAGVLAARRAGAVLVTASAGGWTSDTVTITFGRRINQAILSEDWNTSEAWMLWGEPIPDLQHGPEDILALSTNGDDFIGSGAYSRRTFNPQKGLRIDIAISAVTTQHNWQGAQVGLAPLDREVLHRWDHKAGTLPVQTHGVLCMFTLGPVPGENVQAPKAFYLITVTSRNLQTGKEILKPTPSKRWRLFSLQMFPDGTCGVAVEGNPLLRTQVPFSLPDSAHVLLEGRTYNTTILHGPLVVWQGMPDDIDWRMLVASRPDEGA